MDTLLQDTDRRQYSSSSKSFSPRLRQQHNGRDGHTTNAWTKAAVAELSNDAISELPRRDLIAVIRTGLSHPPNPQVQVELDGRDMPTLRRLAYLSRRSCRNQGY